MVQINIYEIRTEYVPKRIINFNGPEVGKALLKLHTQISPEGANWSDDYEMFLQNFLDLRELTLRHLKIPGSVLSPIGREQADINKLSSTLQISPEDVTKILDFIDHNLREQGLVN